MNNNQEIEIKIEPIPDSLAVNVYVNEKRLNLENSLKVWNHSPTGFSVGYLGSGCAQTALGILLEFIPPEKAVRYHQKFKREYVAKWKSGETYIIPPISIIIEKFLVNALGYDVDF